MKHRGWKGSMTVEAAIIMPIFVIIVFTMIMLTKLVYVHALIQQGLVQTAKEFSTYSYILKEVFHLDVLDDTIVTGLQNNINSTEFNEKLNQISGALDGSTDAQLDILGAVLEDPAAYARDTAVGGLSSVGLGVYNDLLGEVSGAMARAIFPQYVKKSEEELHALLDLLGVENGLDGVRMKGTLPRGDGVTLDIVAAYTINLDPPLAYFLNGKTVVQRASCVPWMGK